jgi:hypothetical protein
MNKPFEEMTLSELAHSQAVLQDYILRAVTQARRGGSTWAGIASSLGVSTSEAHRRYSWVDKIAQPSSQHGAR